jgi:transposase InsO family protein
MKYAMIQQHEDQHAVSLMCRALSVSRSGYSRWKIRKPSARAEANQQLDTQIREAFHAERGRAGAPRIVRALRKQGMTISRRRVARRMKTSGLVAKAGRKFKATTNSKHNLPVAPNLLEQNFYATKPNEKWVSDITYIETREGWLYLAVVLDLYSRLVVGWAMSDRMNKTLVIDALKMALWRRKMPRGVIVHSDRGSQYCSHTYQRLLKNHGLICSMSKKGDCYDNAAMESWNHSLKVESIHGEHFATRADAMAEVFEYIDIYYNRKRLHSFLGYVSPEAFEAQKVS